MVDLKLYGTWPSPYSYRVIRALKLKGIDYEYIEEDLTNKSLSLLQYNPIYKKIPVLVHNGKPVVESMVILEYIEETWPTEYPLLPKDPYERSQARFWAKFVDEKGLSIAPMFSTVGDAQETAIKDTLDFLRIVEDYGLGDKKFFGGHVIGLADLAFGGVANRLRVIEEFVGVKLLDANTFPRLHGWIQNFKGAPVIKENLPDHDELLAFYTRRREMILASQEK